MRFSYEATIFPRATVHWAPCSINELCSGRNSRKRVFLRKKEADLRKRKQRRIAVAVPESVAFVERLLHGIAEYASERGGWTFTRLPDVQGTSVQWLRDWSGDGAFALITTPADGKI